MVQVPDASDELIGTGISFPLQADQRGVLALSHGVTDIEQAIRLILGTAPGERPMRPEFGCAVHDLVFDTIDAEMVGKVETAVHRALARWEPRIDVERPRLRPRGGRPGQADHHDQLSRGRDQPPLQPRVPVLRDPGGGDRLMHRVALDSRDHAELVTEARRRLELACPELNVNGGPDAGATLIELFSWMTGLAIERLGRVPDKLHIALLDLLGIKLNGPAAARTGLRMRLSAPASDPLEIRAGTEAGTLRTATQESIVFTVQEDFTILPLRPAAYVIQRGGTHKEIGVADGVAYPPGPDQLPFSRPPQIGDALYLGFEDSLASLLMSVSIEASMARGAGVRPEDPPLRWECSQGEGRVGRGRGDGRPHRRLQLRLGHRRAAMSADGPGSSRSPAIGLHWLRCRIAETTRVSG